jgi:hypothetical protein
VLAIRSMAVGFSDHAEANRITLSISSLPTILKLMAIRAFPDTYSFGTAPN